MHSCSSSSKIKFTWTFGVNSPIISLQEFVERGRCTSMCFSWMNKLLSEQQQATQKGYSSLLSFTVTDMNNTVTKLMALGAELDGPIKYEVHGKIAAMRCIDGHVLGLCDT
ncbi:hypothetical protein GLYMA_06G264500v4 [Glycine max]|nr:hypothetical protein GLYMA_06G264500v4 [Glycine max]KAH1127758.1 hypothetical protein GYH30_016358 [Glycine max]